MSAHARRISQFRGAISDSGVGEVWRRTNRTSFYTFWDWYWCDPTAKILNWVCSFGKVWRVRRIILDIIQLIRWPKRVNHKSICQNTKQCLKAQTNFQKHKSVYQNTKKFLKNTNQFLKAQINLPKHKTISQNTNQFSRTQTKRLGTCAVIIRESLGGTRCQDFPRPSWYNATWSRDRNNDYRYFLIVPLHCTYVLLLQICPLT